ncbi:MAG: DUF971 domain-containing protein [Candidatus Promineifilaceae bacterium]|nr:DUF971 domain-containing protein [Candidatus Promineifilaceae bacterium]
MNSERPTGVTADRENKILQITWADGHVSRYSFAGLRAVCPCVECKGGHAHMGGPPDPRAVRDAEAEGLSLNQLQAVGSYALQFFWSDGHSTGIYTWSLLRAACPCPECLDGSA